VARRRRMEQEGRLSVNLVSLSAAYLGLALTA
jgi:hypothetical protein